MERLYEARLTRKSQMSVIQVHLKNKQISGNSATNLKYKINETGSKLKAITALHYASHQKLFSQRIGVYPATPTHEIKHCITLLIKNYSSQKIMERQI